MTPNRFLRAALLLLLCLAFAGISTVLSLPVHAADSQYFPQTGHSVSGKFLTYWQTNGGLSVYGYPITDAANEVDPETGKTFFTQWFERRRFELHPENTGTPYEILGGLIGKDLRREALIADPDFVRYAPAVDPAYSKEQQRYFSETGHNVRLRFLEYWQQNGGLARFGLPISESHAEVDPETGKVFLMQWFERARFELHPENSRPYDVLLGLLGNQIKKSASRITYQWKRGVSRDALYGPFVLATDKQGSIYVSTLDDPRVQKYDNAGHFLADFGGNGTANGQFSKEVRAIATDPQNNVYVLDKGTRRLQKFDANGTFLRMWQIAGDDNDEQVEGAVAVDSHGVVYVVTGLEGKVYEFDGNGTPLRTITLDRSNTPTSENSQEPSPNMLAVDSKGNIYIRDMNDAPSDISIRKYDANGHKLVVLGFATFSDTPDGLTLDNQDNVYVCGLEEHTIFMLNAQGKRITQWGGRERDRSLGRERCGLAVDTANNVYLASELENRVDRYNPAHQLVTTWGDEYTKPGQVAYPTDSAYGADGRLYVLNVTSGRVNIYNNTGTQLVTS